jgi:hypothetical protein
MGCCREFQASDHLVCAKRGRAEGLGGSGTMTGMKATVRVRRHLGSESVYLPAAKELLGKDVEIVVREIEETAEPADRSPLRGSVLKDEDPFEPVCAGG